jgi:hypothetical protein
MDAIIQALSGVMLTSGGPADPPVRIGVPFADLAAPLFGVIGVLAAIHQAQSPGVSAKLRGMAGVIDGFAPVLDPTVLPADPFYPHATRISEDVPVIIGNNRAKGRFSAIPPRFLSMKVE